MTKQHAMLSPSSSERWINCPGSVKAISDALAAGIISKSQSTYFADEGTAAHELAEKALSSGGNCFKFEGLTLELENAVTVTREMCSYVQSYVDFVNLFDGDRRIEQRVSFTDWVPNGYGTSDAVIIQDTRLVCIDLKYGQGVKVEAENNTQALCYALGVYQSLSDDQKAVMQSVLIVIHQPRLDSVSEWEIAIDELLRHGERIAQAAELALSDNAPLNPGKAQCRWCDFAPRCPEQLRLIEQTVGNDFDDLTQQTPVNALTDAQITRALQAKEQIVAWLSAVESLVTERLLNGQSFTGFKLVEGRSTRQWNDDGQAAEVLSMALDDDQIYIKKLISPAQAEKALGKSNASMLQDLIVKAAGKPTLAPENDKRPALNISLDDFN